MNDSQLYLFIALVVGGLLLIGGEAFLPGGVIGTLGVIALIGAVAEAFSVGAVYGMYALVGIIILLGIVFWLWIKFFPSSPFGKKLTLHDETPALRAPPEAMAALINKSGISLCDLRPAGFARIDNQKVDVVTEGGMIAKDTPIKVIGVEGIRIIVRKIEPM